MGTPKSLREKIAPSISPAQSYRFNVKRILVVEDDPAISQSLSEILTDFGYEALTASNGSKGLEILCTQRVDGIFLDLEMPVMDGWTMLDELRWQGYQTPVIVMSGGVDPQVLGNLLKEGAQGFLVKPFTLESLRLQCQHYFKQGDDSNSPQSILASEAQTMRRRQEVV